VKIGDLVQKTYGAGRLWCHRDHRAGLVVGWYNYGKPYALALVLWAGETSPVSVGTKYLELVNETR